MFSEWLDEERIWIHLYHHLLLAATRQDNSVFTWLNKTTLEENFNAYFDQYSVDPRRRSADELVQMRETFVPGVIEALRQSQRIAIANSRRTEVSQFDISPEMIKTYASIAPGDGPALADFPSNTFTELWSFLDDTVQQQRPLLSQMGSMAFVISNIDSEEYSNETLSVSSEDEIHEGDKVDAEFNLRELHKNETIVKDEEGRIKATFTMKIIGESQDFEQVNELPSKTSGSSDDTKESCVQPEIRRHLVPPPVFGQVWTRKSPQEFVWTRGHDEWEPAACFRVFRKDNNAYLKLIHRSHLFTQSINPNDKSWKEPYNKALHSIARTYDSDRIVN